MAYPRRGNSRLIWFGSISIMSGGVDPIVHQLIQMSMSLNVLRPLFCALTVGYTGSHSNVQEGDGELM